MNQTLKTTKAALLLEDGTLCIGKSVGAQGTTYGEICFNTGMTGYQEIFTDPSYFGQIVIMTNVHIGNYGVLTEENESTSVMISGLICRNFNKSYSRQMADGDLDNYLINHNLVGISDVDTRMLVRKVREKGAMNCIISTEYFDVETLQSLLKKAPPMQDLELASKVSTKETYSAGDPNSTIKIAVIDFGVKSNIIKSLTERGAYVKVFPYNTTFEEVNLFCPDAYFLSNGPGDPSVMTPQIEFVKKVSASGLPVFGICLGHQLIALANGLETYKLHHGHRGINHPVLNVIEGTAEITSQNHGFSVSAEGLNPEEITVTHYNLNDNTVEGIELKSNPVFSVQYHPESAPGPHDSRYLFDKFIQTIQKYKMAEL